jgi:hypothetical protein
LNSSLNDASCSSVWLLDSRISAPKIVYHELSTDTANPRASGTVSHFTRCLMLVCRDW